MTTDDFTEAARKRAEQMLPLDGGEPDLIFRDRRQLVEMAEWARTHLAAQEPTDAARIIDEHRSEGRWVGNGVRIECRCGHESTAVYDPEQIAKLTEPAEIEQIKSRALDA